MDSLEFFCNDISKQTSAKETFLFNCPEHLFLQSERGWKVYGLKQEGTKKIVAQIYINLNGKTGYSPLRAPFGSLELYTNVGYKNINLL